MYVRPRPTRGFVLSFNREETDGVFPCLEGAIAGRGDLPRAARLLIDSISPRDGPTPKRGFVGTNVRRRIPQATMVQVPVS